MWIWPVALSLGKNNGLLINRCMQAHLTPRWRRGRCSGAGSQTDTSPRRTQGGMEMAGDPRFCFNRTDQHPDSFEKAPVACSSVNGLSIVHWSQSASMETQKKKISHHFNHDSSARWSGGKSLYKWNTGQFLRRTTISRVVCRPPSVCAALAEWIFNDAITRHWFFLEL